MGTEPRTNIRQIHIKVPTMNYHMEKSHLNFKLTIILEVAILFLGLLTSNLFCPKYVQVGHQRFMFIRSPNPL